MTATPIVYIVDDDPSVLRALERLTRSSGLQAQTFTSPKDFLSSQDSSAQGCLVLDVAMPGLNGLELQDALNAQGSCMPIIFITGHGDIPMSVRAMKAGAVDFLTKPFDDGDLLNAVRLALQKDKELRAKRAEIQAVKVRLAKLSPREREVLTHLLAGKLNNQVAADLGTVEKTIKVHRGRVMKKMGVSSLAELARLAELGGLEPAE